MANFDDAASGAVGPAARVKAPRRPRLLIIVAIGVAVLLCLAGIGVMLGLVPNPAEQTPNATLPKDVANTPSPFSPWAASAPIGNVDEAALPEAGRVPAPAAAPLPSPKPRPGQPPPTKSQALTSQSAEIR